MDYVCATALAKTARPLRVPCRNDGAARCHCPYVQLTGASGLTNLPGTMPSLEMTAERSLAPACPRPSFWVRGPTWDGVWILSALWLTPLALWLAERHSGSG